MEKNKLKYDAKFSGKEIEVVPTGRGKQDKFQPDAYQMDVEAETDRIFLCEKLLEQEEINQAKNAVSQNDSKHNASMTMTRGGKTSPTKFQSADPDRSGAVDDEDKIFVTKYICDFGNIVVGQSKRKTFRLTNSGKSPLNFQFDQRVLQQIGLTIEPMRPPKPMAPNTSLQFTVVYSTRKNAKHGKVGYVVPINVQYGPSYNVEFVANLTIPEIDMSSDNVEFNKVCVGTRKIIKVRFENNKEVPCDWSYYFKESIQNAGASKEGDKFSVSPTSGYLLPGQKQTVDVIFTPTHEKVVTQKLQFKCNHNSKLFVLNTRGHGISYSLDVIENHIEMGPVLPYDKSSEKVIQLKNPMAFPIEVFSTDFDKQFIEEEDILKRYELLNNEKGDVIFETLRKAGSGFWQNIKEADELKRKYEDMQARIATIDETLENDFKTPEVEEGAEPEPLSEETIEKKKQLEEEKASLEQKISEIDSISKVEKAVIPKVKTRDRLNIILFGPEKSGKSTIAYFLSEEHQRGIVNLSDLLSWCEKNNTPTYEEAAKYLEERDVECKAQEELEKKKKKKKDGEEEFDPRVYKFIPKEMLCKLIRERCDSEECNAGVIFDNIIGDHWKDEKSIIETICDALQEESVSLVTIGLNTVMDDGLEYCENYRYNLRKMIASKTVEKEALDRTFMEKEPSSKKPSRRGRKEKTLTEEEKIKIEEQKKKAEEEEKARIEKEEEIKRRLDEPEPKVLTEEEKEEYKKKLEEVLELFTEINLKQMNQKHTPQEEAEGEGEQEDSKEEQKEENKDIKDIEEDKKENEEAEGEGKEGEGEEEPKEPPYYGSRILFEVATQYNFRYLCEKVKENIPDPIWPDPDKEPLPAPLVEQIIKKPSNRPERPKVTLFSICTEVEKKENEGEGEEDKEEDKKKGKGKGAPEPEAEEVVETGPFLDDSVTRWILQPGECKPLHVKFFSTKVGKFNQTLNFEVVGATKQFPCEIEALCEFPSINTNTKNVFMLQKRQRPPTAPDSYLSKCYVINEGNFDFGPLLIGKDPEKRGEEEDPDKKLEKANSSQFRITNNGKYDLQVKFALESSLMSEEPQDKSPFIFEPEVMDLKVQDTENLKVWCFPEEDKVYEDKIVALIKENPNPAIFNVKCSGAKPIVKVDNPVVQFDRLLLNKTAKRTLTLTNDCQIPVKWSLKSEEEIPEEFKISKLEGVLKACQDVNVEVTFCSERQDQFNHKLVLEVEDTEGFEIKQEPQEIELVAEAFDITVDIDLKSEENFLDFGDVRVGEPKQLIMTLTNNGKYTVKYGFNMKKRHTREIFEIEPKDGELQPEEAKDIIVRFQSKEEFKMKTSHSSSDIKLTIHEGESKQKFNEIPINFNVNSVFSKFTIVPLRNINFGPMQYGERKELAFEVKNNGHFPFNFAI